MAPAAHERQDIIGRAVKAGVKSARVRGKNLTELDAEELGRLVDRVERFEDLLKALIPGIDPTLYPTTVQDIKNALAGR